MGGDIVVGVDGTPASIGALRWAAAAAIRRGRPLRLVHCVGWPAYTAASGMVPPDQDDDQVRGPAGSLIERLAAQAHEWAPNVPVHGVVLRGGPAAILRDESRAADLVVVGSRRGSGGISGLLLGSVSIQVARHAARTVVVVPGGAPPAARATGPAPPTAVGTDSAPQTVVGTGSTPRIVVGTDGSAGAEAALAYAFAEAAALAATIAVVRVGGHADLDRTLAPWRERHPAMAVDATVVDDHHPAAVLARAAEGADQLVIGARGHGGLGGLHLGSVTLAVLHHARLPVAVARPAATG